MNINIFTYNLKGTTSTRLGFPVYNYKTFPLKEYNNSIVVRWGNSTLLDVRDFKNVINPSAAIAQNCRKLFARKKLGEVVNTPKLYETKVPKGVTAVVRPYEHEAGNDFQIKQGPFELDYGWYASEFIKTDTEFRVWFANGKTIGGIRKPWKDQTITEFPCRSKWAYEYAKVPLKLAEDTIKAANKIGLVTGAADVLVKDNKYYFLELNSAPAIDTCTIERFYRENIIRYAISKWGTDLNLELK